MTRPVIDLAQFTENFRKAFMAFGEGIPTLAHMHVQPNRWRWMDAAREEIDAAWFIEDGPTRHRATKRARDEYRQAMKAAMR